MGTEELTRPTRPHCTVPVRDLTYSHGHRETTVSWSEVIATLKQLLPAAGKTMGPQGVELARRFIETALVVTHTPMDMVAYRLTWQIVLGMPIASQRVLDSLNARAYHTHEDSYHQATTASGNNFQAHMATTQQAVYLCMGVSACLGGLSAFTIGQFTGKQLLTPENLLLGLSVGLEFTTQPFNSELAVRDQKLLLSVINFTSYSLGLSLLSWRSTQGDPMAFAYSQLAIASTKKILHLLIAWFDQEGCLPWYHVDAGLLCEKLGLLARNEGPRLLYSLLRYIFSYRELHKHIRLDPKLLSVLYATCEAIARTTNIMAAKDERHYLAILSAALLPTALVVSGTMLAIAINPTLTLGGSNTDLQRYSNPLSHNLMLVLVMANQFLINIDDLLIALIHGANKYLPMKFIASNFVGNLNRFAMFYLLNEFVEHQLTAIEGARFIGFAVELVIMICLLKSMCAPTRAVDSEIELKRIDSHLFARFKDEDDGDTPPDTCDASPSTEEGADSEDPEQSQGWCLHRLCPSQPTR